MSIHTQHRVLRDPQAGEVVRVEPGSRLELRFRRRGLGLSRWQVEDRPAHLVPLEEGDHGFHFLVFRGEVDGPSPCGSCGPGSTARAPARCATSS